MANHGEAHQNHDWLVHYRLGVIYRQVHKYDSIQSLQIQRDN